MTGLEEREEQQRQLLQLSQEQLGPLAEQVTSTSSLDVR